jgi:hypothetical protein
MMGWFEMLHRASACNTKEKDARRHQYGGNAIFSINNVVHHVLKSGKDGTGLGQWVWTRVWTRYRGRNSIVTRVVCAYHPCKPTGDNKVHSVYTQHQHYFDEKQDDICPGEAFVRDLCEELDMWLAMGDQVVIALDSNDDMAASWSSCRGFSES